MYWSILKEGKPLGNNYLHFVRGKTQQLNSPWIFALLLQILCGGGHIKNTVLSRTKHRRANRIGLLWRGQNFKPIHRPHDLHEQSMQVGRTLLFTEEHEWRIKNHICLYCGQAGLPLHLLVTVPLICYMVLDQLESFHYPNLNLMQWKSYFEEELSKNLICPSTSSGAAGFFFVGKKHRGQCPCFDYPGLNDIMVKFRYPLSLVPAAIKQVRTSKFHTKLNLRCAYNILQSATRGLTHLSNHSFGLIFPRTHIPGHITAHLSLIIQTT